MTTGDLRRVLIIDDNVDLAENIAEILQMDGHTTEVAVPVIVDTFWPTLERAVTQRRAKAARTVATTS